MHSTVQAVLDQVRGDAGSGERGERRCVTERGGTARRSGHDARRARRRGRHTDTTKSTAVILAGIGDACRHAIMRIRGSEFFDSITLNLFLCQPSWQGSHVGHGEQVPALHAVSSAGRTRLASPLPALLGASLFGGPLQWQWRHAHTVVGASGVTAWRAWPPPDLW